MPHPDTSQLSLRRLPNAIPVLVVSVVAGLFQSFGIALFVPVLNLISDSAVSAEPLHNAAKTIFSVVGIPFNLMWLLVMVTTLVLIGLGCNYLRRILVYRSMIRFMRQMRNDLVATLLAASWDFLSRQASGSALNNLLTQSSRSAMALQSQLSAYAEIIQALVFLGFSLALSWHLILITLAFGLTAHLVATPIRRRASKLGQQQTKAEERYCFHVTDYLRSIRLIKASSFESRVGEKVDTYLDQQNDAIMRKQVNLANIEFVSQAFPVVLLSTVILVGFQVLELGSAELLVFTLFLVRAAPVVARFQQFIHRYQQDLPALTAVDDAIAANRAAAEEVGAEGETFTTLQDAIQFKSVSYRFAGVDAPTLDGINLEIPRGKMVALVGGSGAGKSTLIELLCGMRRPTEGSVCVDGTDLARFDIRTWRRRIGYVTQDTVILNASVRDNLSLVYPEATDADIFEALRMSQLEDVVGQMDDGLDTLLGEGGVRLSGGQRQRLALARALVGHPEVLVLDEATSSLDSESERLVLTAIENLAHHMTIVAVAHRLSTVRKADIIYVVEQGGVVEKGTYDHLVNLGQRFAELHHFQVS